MPEPSEIWGFKWGVPAEEVGNMRDSIEIKDGEERKNGKYYRLLESHITIENGSIKDSDGNYILNVLSGDVKIRTSTIQFLEGDPDTKETVWHIYLKENENE